MARKPRVAAEEVVEEVVEEAPAVVEAPKAPEAPFRMRFTSSGTPSLAELNNHGYKLAAENKAEKEEAYKRAMKAVKDAFGKKD